MHIFAIDRAKAVARCSNFISKRADEEYREEFHKENTANQLLGFDSFADKAFSLTDQRPPQTLTVEKIL